jgi:hypothetical protein
MNNEEQGEQKKTTSKQVCEYTSTYLDDELILDSALLDSGAGQHVHGANHLLAQEVTDVNGLATVGDLGVDGKVSVHSLHLVQESLRSKQMQSWR